MVGPQWDKETTELVIGWFGLKKNLMFLLRCSDNKCIISGSMGGFVWWSLRSNLD